MSLKTRCPACDTVFKIVPDQLKVSKGWVRCGRCAEVFDAAAHAASAEDVNQWPQTSAPAATAVMTSQLIATSEDPRNTPENVATQAINTSSTAILKPIKEHEETDLSFVRTAKNKFFWQKKNVISSLRAACLGLAGLLFFQAVFSQRNQLVAATPALKTSFDFLCQTVGCKMEAFKNIDAFKIDSSSFQKTHTTADEPASVEVFALKLTLKNSSDLPLAMPAVELTLTESGDKPVLRRVLLAKDLGFSDSTLAANVDWTGEVKLAVTSNPTMPPITGYRVLLFYP